MDSEQPVLAPSEVVFAAPQTQMSERERVAAALKAALLACEFAGETRLDLNGRRVSAQRIASPHPWPRYSVESRLDCESARDVADMIAEWLAQDTIDPWALAAEKIHVALTLRGLAAKRPHRGANKRDYTISPAAQAQAKAEARAVTARLRACQTKRAPLSQALDEAIARGIERRRTSGENKWSADPWDVESTPDRLKFAEPIKELAALGSLIAAAGFFGIM